MAAITSEHGSGAMPRTGRPSKTRRPDRQSRYRSRWSVIKTRGGVIYAGCQATHGHHPLHVRVTPTADRNFTIEIATAGSSSAPTPPQHISAENLPAHMNSIHVRGLVKASAGNPSSPVRCIDCIHFEPAHQSYGPFPPKQAPGGCRLQLTDPKRRPPIYPITGHFCHGWWPRPADPSLGDQSQ